MKHSKLFLTGMAALLLSFGLMMTGCDSGGGSDDPSESPDDYFVITRTNPGSSTGGDYAVFTVQVKKSLAGKQVEFANVAAGNVTYTNADADTTIASQTTALIGFFTTQATKYGAAVEGTTTDTVKLTATENPPAEIPVANGPKVVDVTDIPAPPPEDTWLPPAASGEDGVFTVVADADSVTAVGEIHYAAGTVTYWTTEKVTKTIGAGPLQTLLLTLAATDTFTIAVVNNVEQIINITINGTTADVPTGKTLTVGAGTTLDTGAAGVLAVTGTL
ncbi:MAG: hypothetical protein LBD24_04390, partial [Spirochaetaceae bacterium]|nr:hypothetical protein [Spirochaetaceae bacterium]